MQTLTITGTCYTRAKAESGYIEQMALTSHVGLHPELGFSLLDLLIAKPIQPTYYVAGWTGNNNYSDACVNKETGNVKSTVQIPDGHPDMLKLSLLGRVFDEETQLTKNFPIVSGVIETSDPV